MNYSIYITAAAEQDMANASDYIEFVLKNPKAADDLLDEAEEKINALSSFPAKFPLVEDPLLASWGIRLTLVRNYIVLVLVNKCVGTTYKGRYFSVHYCQKQAYQHKC